MLCAAPAHSLSGCHGDRLARTLDEDSFRLLYAGNIPEGSGPFSVLDLVISESTSTSAQGPVPACSSYEFWLPKSELPRFLAGECMRGRTRFVTRHTKSADPGNIHKRARHDTLVLKETYHCCFGPDSSCSHPDVVVCGGTGINQ
eukprot:scaffold182550_cov22-Tisochrysis_lutea.AAC.1